MKQQTFITKKTPHHAWKTKSGYMFNGLAPIKSNQNYGKLHDYQTISALEKASHEFDTLIKFTRCSELQTSLWQMFQDSLCRYDDRSIPDDILIRTELYDTLRNILNQLDKVIPKSGHAFTISYGPKGVH